MEATAALVAVELGLRVGGVRPCLAVSRLVRRGRAIVVVAEDLDGVALAVRRSSAYLPLRPACLPQSLAVAWMLARRGIDAELRFGVGSTGETIRAHAWVQIEGTDWRFDVSPAGGFVPLEKGPAR